MKRVQTTSLPAPCAAWADRLAALHPDDLRLDERISLKHHLAECPACAAADAAYQQMDTRILSLPIVQLSAQQIAHVETSMTDQTVRTVPLERLVPPAPSARVPMRLMRVERRASALRDLSGLAAVLVVAVLVGSAFALFSLHRAPSATTPASPMEHGTLYTVSYAGTVYAIEPGSGKIIWSTPLQMTPDEQFLVSRGTIFLASSCIRSTCDLYALQASNGHVLWQRSYKDLLGNAGASSLSRYLASDGKTLYIGSATGIYAWRASDGQQLWHHTPPSACLANPDACLIDMETASNGLVYVYFDGLYALNATDGSTRWFNLQVPNLDFTSYPLVVTHNHIYVANYGRSLAVHVLQATTGKLLDTPNLPQDMPYDIITDGSLVYIRTTPAFGGSADIYALRSSDNKLLWHQHEVKVVGLDAVSAGSLYYNYLATATSASAQTAPLKSTARATRHVCALRTTDGSLQWCQPLPAGFLPSAAASQGIMYVPGGDQGLDAIRLSDGEILWHSLAHVSLDDADTVLV